MAVMSGRCVSLEDGIGYPRHWAGDNVPMDQFCQHPACAIESRLLEDPISFTACQHTICRQHIADLTMFSCPVCESEVDNKYDDAPAIEKALDEMPVLDHTSGQDYRPEETIKQRLDNSRVQCPVSGGCTVQLTMGVVKLHMSTECEFRKIKCDHCGMNFRYQDWRKMDHNNTCTAVNRDETDAPAPKTSRPDEPCPAGCVIPPGQTVADHMACDELFEMHQKAVMNKFYEILPPQDNDVRTVGNSLGEMLTHAIVQVQNLKKKEARRKEATGEMLNSIINMENPDGVINSELFQKLLSPEEHTDG